MNNSILGKISKQVLAFSLIGVLLVLPSCKEDEVVPEAIATFSYVVNELNYLEVAFTGENSNNATSYAWDFADPSTGDLNTSTEANPTHIFSGTGTFNVKLVVANSAGVESVVFAKDVLVEDPLELQRALIGENGKVWQLVADVSTGVYPFMIQPEARNDIWWAFGGQHDYDKLCVRECVFDDTWTFNTDGTYTFENNGDFWGEGGVWPDDVVGCFDATVPANWVGKDGQDLSGWNSGTHNFVYDPAEASIVVTGGFIGLSKVGTTAEVTEPQVTVEYNVVKLIDEVNGVDTLVVETPLVDDAGATYGYWTSTLVSYDNIGDKIIIEECPPVTSVDVTFKLNFNDYTGVGVTPEVNGTFNNWCGNCNAMTDVDGDGVWEVTLPLAPGDYEYKFSADNWADQEALTEGSSCTLTTEGNTNRTLTVGTTNMTAGPVCWNSCDNCPPKFTATDIVGSWSLAAEAGAMGVGPGSGDISWWSNSLDDATTTRACLFDDVFTFVNDGSFTIQQDGSTWVETWQGIGADACASPVAPHDGSGSYTYEATATTVKVIGQGAFLASPKAYNGGEAPVGVDVPNDITYTVTDYSVAGDGTKSLTIEIDISAAQDGTAFWTYKLVSN